MAGTVRGSEGKVVKHTDSEVDRVALRKRERVRERKREGEGERERSTCSMETAKHEALKYYKPKNIFKMKSSPNGSST